MQETGNNQSTNIQQRLVIRISRGTMAFAVADTKAPGQLLFEPYIMKGSISPAANLRDAFTTSVLLQRGYQRALVMTDAKPMMLPVEEYADDDTMTLYDYAFSRKESELLAHTVLPDLNTVAVFAFNKDLYQVLADHFSNLRVEPLMLPVWTYLHRRSFAGNGRKLYAFFHEQVLEVFCFLQNRFRFYNRFEASRPRDSAFYLLYVWKQLSFDARRDVLCLVGDVPEGDTLTELLRRHLVNVQRIRAGAEFLRAPITQVKGITFDMITRFVKS